MNRDLAIVSMVCKAPGAENIEQLWSMLLQGKEGLRSLTEEERRHCDSDPKNKTVYAGGFIEGIEQFDPELFGYTTRDALFMDPQHRLFLQACAEALEISGHAGNDNRSVGVFACAGHNAYLTEVILKNGLQKQQHFAALLGNSPDCLATRVSYSLNLTGPSLSIQCGCSSSLVAVHQARLALLARQCDAALVGGISLVIPTHQGYTPMEGGFASPDGHCRPFSKDAAGPVFSSGYGVVVLKRLADAVQDGDLIYAVIKGSAINNDGSDKAAFTAPSVNGQAHVIAKALRVAEIDPSGIQYIETHGTATAIGDPIELAALERVFSSGNGCLIGSIKANIGHLDVAAGIIGLIKVSLMLHHNTLTPQLYFNGWNPAIAPQQQSLFHINSVAKVWPENQGNARRAGVSAFGFGGTNAHIVMEEAPCQVTMAREEDIFPLLIVLSARSEQRLMDWIQRIAFFVEQSPHLSLSSLVYTLQTGRQQEPYRYCQIVHSRDALLLRLKSVTTEDIVQCLESIDAVPMGDDVGLEALQRQWLRGAYIDWRSIYSNRLPAKCLLPATPLQSRAYWFHENTLDVPQVAEKRYGAYEQWLYQTAWHEIPLPSVDHLSFAQPILIIGDLKNVSLQSFLSLCRAKEIAHEVLEPYFKTEIPAHAVPATVLYWVDLPKSVEALPEVIEQTLKWVIGCEWINSVSVYAFVVSGMSALFYRDSHPQLSAFIALSRGIRQEIPHVTTKLIDLDPVSSAQAHCQQLKQSLLSPTLHDYAIWRDGKCWQMRYQNSVFEAAPNLVTPYFKTNGIYLITGGFGNVASVHIDYLATDYQATLVLLSRTQLPLEDEWNSLLEDAGTELVLKKRLRQLRDWRSKRFAIVPFTADVTSEADFRRVCQIVQAQYGKIDGIIHIAGVGSDQHYKVLPELTAQHCEQLFLPKLQGMQVVASMMNEFKIPDCLIISSISSALAGMGLAAYACVHNLLDAYVTKYHPTWKIMNWDAWNFHLKTAEDALTATPHIGSSMDKFAITYEEGLALLRTAFRQASWQQLYISSIDLPSRVRQWVCRENKSKQPVNLQRFPRPILRSEYIKPSTEVEQQLVALWESLIGVEPIGIHDNFFELGGDSLLALELMTLLQTSFNYTCAIMELFAAATIEKLAKRIRPSLTKPNKRFANARARGAKQRERYSKV